MASSAALTANAAADITAGDSSAEAEEEKPKNSKQPKYTKLTQQELGACKPVLEPIWVMLIFVAVGVVLIPVGAVCLAYGTKPVELSMRYDQDCFPAGVAVSTNFEREDYIWKYAGVNASLSCNVTMTVEHDMKAPVYVYYELNGFYQNHRRYVKSVADQQLVNKSGSLDTCDPEEYYAGQKSLPINPCGLIAWSFFNDTYDVMLSSGGTAAFTEVAVTSEGTAYQSDVNHRYSDYIPENYNTAWNSSRGGGTFNTSVKANDRFITWMRVAALPNFRKLWGIISTDLAAGDVVQITVVNNYNTYKFNGQKKVVLSTTTWLGSYNPFLGIAYLATGSLSLFMALVYLALRLARPRKFGDINALSINRIGR